MRRDEEFFFFLPSDSDWYFAGMIRSVSELIKDEEEQGRAFDRAITKKKDHDEPGPAGPTTNESTTGVASRGVADKNAYLGMDH